MRNAVARIRKLTWERQKAGIGDAECKNRETYLGIAVARIRKLTWERQKAGKIKLTWETQ